MGEVDVNVLLGCPNAREGMTEELGVSLSLVLIHCIEKQHHHHIISYFVFINMGLSTSPSAMSTLTRWRAHGGD